MFQGKLHDGFELLSWIFDRSFKGLSRLFQGSFKKFFKVFQRSFVSVFQGSSVFESFIVAGHSLIAATRSEGGHVYQLVQSVFPRGCGPNTF